MTFSEAILLNSHTGDADLLWPAIIKTQSINSMMINSKLSHVFTSLLLFLVLMASFSSHAQTIGPNRVLIRNVILFDPNGAVEDKVVNILLRDNKLDIVTEDKISRDDADMIVNAREGILMGRLEIGQKPSFIIFEEDPRDNFEVMLDTFTYSIFAVDDGVVVKNLLIGAVADEPEEEPISMNRLTAGTFLPNQERPAISDAMFPSRNIGIVWSGNSPDKYSNWAFGAFNNWLEEKESFDEGATQYVGRLTWAPLVSEDESNLLHVGVVFRLPSRCIKMVKEPGSCTRVIPISI